MIFTSFTLINGAATDQRAKTFMLNKALEITERQAEELFYDGYVVYFHCANLTPDTSFNCFTMRNDSKDASLNMHLYGKNPTEVGFKEYVRFISQQQAEPIRFWTLYSKELLSLPLA